VSRASSPLATAGLEVPLPVQLKIQVSPGGSVSLSLGRVRGRSLEPVLASLNQNPAKKPVLFLSLLKNCRRTSTQLESTPAPGRGSLRPTAPPFGRPQKTAVMQSCIALAKQYPDRGTQQAFFTATLPGDCIDAARGWAVYSSWFRDRLSDSLRRQPPTPLDWCYVWELQQRGALHCHLALAGDSRSIDWAYDSLSLSVWRLLETLRDTHGVPVFQRPGRPDTDYNTWIAGVEPIHTSLSAYLAKYITKGGDSLANARLGRWWPSSWWGRSRNLSRLVKLHSPTVTLQDTRENDLESLHSRVFQLIPTSAVVSSQFPWPEERGETTIVTLSEADMGVFLSSLRDCEPLVWEALLDDQRYRWKRAGSPAPGLPSVNKSASQFTTI